MNDDKAGYSESIARTSARDVSPMPADLDARLAARTAFQDRVFDSSVAQPDADIAAVFAGAPIHAKHVAAPYLEKMATIREERDQRFLTPEGYEARRTALKDGLTRDLDEQVFGPQTRQLEAAAQRYTGMLQDTPVTAEDRAAAIALATELRLLTPLRGIARFAEVVRTAAMGDPATDDSFGVVRAALPFMKSFIEQKDSPWYGNDEVYGMIGKVEGALVSWRKDLAEQRLFEIANLQHQLEGLRQAAIEEDGNIEKSLRYRLSDFVHGSLRMAPQSWPDTPGHARWKRQQQTQAAAARAAFSIR